MAEVVIFSNIMTFRWYSSFLLTTGLFGVQLTAVQIGVHQLRHFVNNPLRTDELMPGVMLQAHLFFLLDTMRC
jgi:hypothetical protein